MLGQAPENGAIHIPNEHRAVIYQPQNSSTIKSFSHRCLCGRGTAVAVKTAPGYCSHMVKAALGPYGIVTIANGYPSSGGSFSDDAPGSRASTLLAASSALTLAFIARL